MEETENKKTDSDEHDLEEQQTDEQADGPDEQQSDLSSLSKKERRQLIKQQRREERSQSESNRKTKTIINYSIALIVVVAFVYFGYTLLKFKAPTPGDDPFLGSPTARLTIIEFGDYNCPYTKEFNTAILPELLKEYDGQIKVVFKDMITGKHGNSELVSEGAECANEQGKYNEYHNVIFVNQGDPSKPQIIQAAQRAGVDSTAFKECLDSGKYGSEVRDDTNEGRKAKVGVTPTLFINNIQMNGLFSLEDYKSAISGELAKSGG